MVGAIALCESGDFIAGMKQGLAIVNRRNGSVNVLHHPETHLAENRYNDGKCDPMGRFWIGSTSIKNTRNAGSLYRIDSDGKCSLAIEGVTMSNGMAWSPDNSTFYYIDTPTFEVAAFDYNVNTGQISNGRKAFSIHKSEGLPDGMTVDSEGMLWIAHWGGWQVSRWDPNSGQKLMSFRLPVALVTSCTFGGDDLRDLYITSASIGLTEKQHEEQPLAGSLFVIKNCGYQGIAPAVFAHY
jgi:sugar lactone lactonase YvrE